ncbi:MAG: hypothetical protein EXX96DRAFT_563848 [Benjaminiella poitrasii]|nr:MAG: hypothetical protein EXX96DRAFT_563848 [Benjaminiella poitrasii]
MTAITMLPTNPCLVKTCRKRKRSTGLHVRFCNQPQNIIYTYSQADYDRSGLFPNSGEHEQKRQFIVSLSISHQKQDHPQMIIQQPILSATKKSKKSGKNRPSLSIDTSNLHGPLYFTKMTTNHQKNLKICWDAEVDDLKEEVDAITMENTRRNSLPLVLC